MAQHEERNCAAADDDAFVSSQANVIPPYFEKDPTGRLPETAG